MTHATTPRASAFVFVAALILATSGDAHAQWPQFRGPNGLGVAPDATALPVTFGPTTNLAWKVRVPRGCSSPCISNGRIFLTAFDSEEKQLLTICIDRQSGEVLWRRVAPAQTLE